MEVDETTEKAVVEYYENTAADAVNLDLKDFNLMRDMTDESATGLWDAELRAFVDNVTLKILFFSEDWVFIPIDRIASKISSVPLRVMKTTIVNGKKIKKPDEAHWIQRIIDNPNEFQCYETWMYSVVVDLANLGNAIVYFAPNAQSLVTIPGEIVRLDFGSNGVLRSYQVQSFNRDDQPALRGMMAFEPKQIAHMRRANPSSMMWGLSPLLPGRKSILFNRYSSEYLNQFYTKGAQPGLTLEMSGEANEKQALRLLRAMELAYTGRRNQRRNMVLPKGVKPTSFSHSLADQQLKEHILTNRETIINLFQVPKQELSIAETGSLGSEEYKTAIKNFWNGPLKSYMNLIAGELTKTMKAYLGTDRTIEFDTSDVEALKDDEDKKAMLAEKLLKTHTLNEVRAKIYELPPVPDGDKVQGLVPPMQQFSAPPPVKEPEPVVVTQEAPTDETKALLTRNVERFTTLSADKDWWKERERKADHGLSVHSVEMNKLALDLFADQAVAIVKEVKNNTTEKAAVVPSKAKLRKRIQTALESFEEKWIEGYIKTLETQVEVGYDVSLTLPFNIPNQTEVEALRARNKNGRLAILEERGLDSFANISRTTTDKIMDMVAQGVAQSKTIQDIAKDIEDYFTNDELIGSRSMLIARTEVLTASSIGQAAAMKDAATVIPNLKKMWINAGDERVRGNPGGLYPDSKADHWSIGGEVRSHDKAFSNGLLYPRDLNGPPEQTIQCRCTIVMVPGEDAERLGLEELESEFGG